MSSRPYSGYSCSSSSALMKPESTSDAGCGRALCRGGRPTQGILTPCAIMSMTQALAPSSRHAYRAWRTLHAGRFPGGILASREGAEKGVAGGDGIRTGGDGATGSRGGGETRGPALRGAEGGARELDPWSVRVAEGGSQGSFPFPPAILISWARHPGAPLQPQQVGRGGGRLHLRGGWRAGAAGRCLPGAAGPQLRTRGRFDCTKSHVRPRQYFQRHGPPRG